MKVELVGGAADGMVVVVPPGAREIIVPVFRPLNGGDLDSKGPDIDGYLRPFRLETYPSDKWKRVD